MHSDHAAASDGWLICLDHLETPEQHIILNFIWNKVGFLGYRVRNYWWLISVPSGSTETQNYPHHTRTLQYPLTIQWFWIGCDLVIREGVIRLYLLDFCWLDHQDLFIEAQANPAKLISWWKGRRRLMICTTYKFTSISCHFPQLNYVTFVLFIYSFFCFSLGIWMLYRIVSLDPQVLKSPITTPATKHPTLLRSHQHYLPQT